MKIRSYIDNNNGRYRVQIETLGFTANEEEKLLEFGEPQIDIGSTFNGSASRPGENPTIVTILPVGAGAGATATATVDDTGAVVSVVITNAGGGYTSGATAVVTGDGSAATLTVTVDPSLHTVTGIAVSAGGSGYNQVPLSVTFSFPPTLRRIRADFPIVQVFDLNDTPEADVRAKVFSDTITSRLIAAKTGLLLMTSNFEGETLTTV
jgi:hypothetical protein